MCVAYMLSLCYPLPKITKNEHLRRAPMEKSMREPIHDAVPLVISYKPSACLRPRCLLQNSMIGRHPSSDEGIPGCLLFFTSITTSYAFLNAVMAPAGGAVSAGGRSCMIRAGVGPKEDNVG
jgi:hypothetical protein